MGDLPPAHQRIVTSFAGRFMARSVLLFFMIWALGGGTYVGLSEGFARADDTDKKINEAIGPMKEDIAELKTEQRRTSTQVESILRLNLETRLRDLQRQYCNAEPNTPNRRLVDQNIRDTQYQYRRVNEGKSYDMPNCSDI